MNTPKLCARAACSKYVRQRATESNSDYRKRKFCGPVCARLCKPWSATREKRRDAI